MSSSQRFLSPEITAWLLPPGTGREYVREHEEKSMPTNSQVSQKSWESPVYVRLPSLGCSISPPQPQLSYLFCLATGFSPWKTCFKNGPDSEVVRYLSRLYLTGECWNSRPSTRAARDGEQAGDAALVSFKSFSLETLLMWILLPIFGEHEHALSMYDKALYVCIYIYIIHIYKG